MKKLLAFAALTALTSSAFAAYVPLPAANPVQQGSAPVQVLVNKESLRTENNLKLMWVEFLFKTPQQEKSDPKLTFSSATAHLAFDCKAGTYALRAEKHYEMANRQGKLIYDYVVPQEKVVFGKWMPLSSAAAEAAVACGN